LSAALSRQRSFNWYPSNGHPLSPLQQQLRSTLQRAQVLVPQLERLQCFAQPVLPGAGHLLLHDSDTSGTGTAAGGFWQQPLEQLQAGKPAGRVHAERLPGYLIAFQARDGVLFDAAARQTLALVAQALVGGLRQDAAGQTERPHDALRLAAEVAHASARLRDVETGNHLERVHRFTRLIAEAVAPHFGLSEVFVDQVSVYARLHDIGKIGIPDAILLKPGRLDAEETAVMRTHVRKGLEILEQVLQAQGIEEQPATRLMANLIGTHHERLDGSGYPVGLRGDAIPIEGRIVAVADVFDAVTSTRPYRRGVSVVEGLALVQQQADGGLLDPVCVAALVGHQAELERIVAAFQDLPEAGGVG
jgi:HD-GYP domain-containing protein (c-di-GMP phosphodiesterase class II)